MHNKRFSIGSERRAGGAGGVGDEGGAGRCIFRGYSVSEERSCDSTDKVLQKENTETHSVIGNGICFVCVFSSLGTCSIHTVMTILVFARACILCSRRLDLETNVSGLVQR